MEICALAARGWSVFAISRHTGRDRKTVRKYLAAPRAAGAVAAPSCLEPFRAFIAARFEDDRHLEATVLYRELLDAGFGRSYPTLVRELRRLELRPVAWRARTGAAARSRPRSTTRPGRRSSSTGWSWRRLGVDI